MSPATSSTAGVAPEQAMPEGDTASLASVAGRLTTLLGGVGAPLYGVGAIVAEGAGRWVMLGMFAVLVVSACLPPRKPSLREAPLTLALCVSAMVLWGAVAPGEGLLRAAVLAVGMVYVALMAPRPYAEIGLVLMTVAYLGSYLMFATPGGLSWQVLGVAVADYALGLLLVCVRVITERRVNERTRALAAANARLEQLTRLDPLTGLANRRRLGEVLDSAWTSAAAGGEPVTVLMVDIDHFKQYNDHYGHLQGDACLQKVAAALAGAVRGHDVVARYGGEEFSVVMPRTELEAGYAVAERLRGAIAGLAEEHATAPSGSLTISVGVASAHPGDDPLGCGDDLLRLADNGLYAAKSGGRNRVVAGTA